LQYIDTSIREKGVVTVKEVVEKFEVSPRTVKRDLEYSETRINAPIVYDVYKKGYVYSLPFDYFSYRNERMLLFYLFLMKLIESPTHFPFVDKAIPDLIKRNILAHYLPLMSRITYEIDEWEQLDITLFSKLFSTLRNDNCIVIKYADVTGKTTTRTIAPEHFIHYEGRWYVIAYDETKKGIRTFLLSRIQKAEVVNKKRTRKINDDELQKFIKSTYGIYKGSGGKLVQVRFYQPVCNIVKKTGMAQRADHERRKT
jgi:predicted DNA-binding transcriptional regulator YafY